MKAKSTESKAMICMFSALSLLTTMCFSATIIILMDMANTLCAFLIENDIVIRVEYVIRHANSDIQITRKVLFSAKFTTTINQVEIYLSDNVECVK